MCERGCVDDSLKKRQCVCKGGGDEGTVEVGRRVGEVGMNE